MCFSKLSPSFGNQLPVLLPFFIILFYFIVSTSAQMTENWTMLLSVCIFTACEQTVPVLNTR